MTIKLPESYKDITDAVICSENTRTPTDTYNTEVKDTHAPTNSNNTTVKSTHAPSTPTPTPALSSLFTIPTVMESGNVPQVLCMILGRTFPILLDTGAQISVLPLKMAKYFQLPVNVPPRTCEVGTFGTNKVTLRGPALLSIQIAGIKIPHFFYFIDADAPPLVGHDLVRVARLVIDVANRLVFSRRDDWACCDKPINPQGPNPPVSLKNSYIQACVQFFEVSFLPIIEEEDEDVDDSLSANTLPSPVDKISVAESEVDGPSLVDDTSFPTVVHPCRNPVISESNLDVEPTSTLSANSAAVAPVVSEVSSCDDSSLVQPSTLVEPASSPSSIVSRQLSVVRPPSGCHAVPLNPCAVPFRPRVEPNRDAPLSSASTLTPQPLYLLVHPLVDPNDTVIKLPAPSGSVFSVTPPMDDTSVPPHLQELFDQTAEQANLTESLQRSLAAVLRHNSVTFATSPEDLGFCGIQPHHIDTGDAQPIKQPPSRPPLSGHNAEDEILGEMLRTGVIQSSNSPWSSPVCMVKKKDGPTVTVLTNAD